MLESDCKNLCEKIVVVTAPQKTRLERIIKRDKLSEKDALIRINAQKDDEYYFSKAHIIIRNYDGYDLQNELSPLEELIND